MTIFGVLFGLGFWLQADRAKGDFIGRYARRLGFLFLIGLIHFVFVFTWDILHLYALCGFVLLATRNLSDRALFAAGLILGLFGRPIVELAMSLIGWSDAWGASAAYDDSAALERQALGLSGDYLGLVWAFLRYTWLDYFVGATLLAWLPHTLGRFMIGAWIGRRNVLRDPERFVGGFARIAKTAIPAGLLLELASEALKWASEEKRIPESDLWQIAIKAIHAVGSPVLAAGYACVALIIFHQPQGKRLLSPFAAAGKMALTLYVAQSLVLAGILFRIGPGLGLAGKIGITGMLAFAAQVWISRWWLGRFTFGPLEWAWRSLTYGWRVRFRAVA